MTLATTSRQTGPVPLSATVAAGFVGSRRPRGVERPGYHPRPMGRLGFVKDAYLRTRAAVEPTIQRAAAVHLHPRLRRAVIRELNFELCSACNLRCRFCSLDSKLRAGMMKIETFDRVLAEIRDDAKFDVRYLNLHHSGDALLHPRFGLFLERIAAEKRRRGKRFPHVNLLTSATHLKGDRVEALLSTDAVDWVRFSVDGGNRDDFERIRVGAKWDEVLGNINSFLDEAQRRGRRVRTGVIAVFDKPQPDISDEFKALLERITNDMPRYPHTWVGNKDVGVAKKPVQPTGLCVFVLNQTVVLYDGSVTLCCNDLNAEGVIGSVYETPLYDIFRGEKRAEVIRKMRAQRRTDLPMCGTCEMD
jgi:sulfatase maturation enzyme AslB (radical SAM superfamily)